MSKLVVKLDRSPRWTFIAISVLVAALRFTFDVIPVHLSSWPHWYMALSHMWFGALVLEATRRNWTCLVAAVLLFVVEIGAFVMFKLATGG